MYKLATIGIVVVGLVAPAYASAEHLRQAAYRGPNEARNAVGVSVGAHRAAAVFVRAVNRRDWRTACGMYSRRYLRVSQADCRSFYAWGASLYGPYRYVVVGIRQIGTRYHINLTSRGRPDFFELKREHDCWKVVAGGW
jgi:hypothetical protein